jgi:hypothetical protein
MSAVGVAVALVLSFLMAVALATLATIYPT